MGCFEIDRRGAVVLERGFPARNTNTPFVAGFESWKSPFGNGCDEIVPVEHREIQKLAGDFHADGVQADIFGSGSTKAIAKKSGHRIAATTFEFGTQNVGRHKSGELWLFSRNGRFAFALPERLLDCAPWEHRAFHTLRKLANTAHHEKIAELLR